MRDNDGLRQLAEYVANCMMTNVQKRDEFVCNEEPLLPTYLQKNKHPDNEKACNEEPFLPWR